MTAFPLSDGCQLMEFGVALRVTPELEGLIADFDSVPGVAFVFLYDLFGSLNARRNDRVDRKRASHRLVKFSTARDFLCLVIAEERLHRRCNIFFVLFIGAE